MFDLLMEFADEDHAFAEEGMGDYAIALHQEDQNYSSRPETR
ncbi:MAG: hypothetical protein WA902_03300 [Thermosynechococcaceae cyanobacterium]